MSFGGEGIPGIEPGARIISGIETDLGFIPQRFLVGGRFKVEDGARAKTIPLHTCVLCGGLILKDDEWNYEHPFPRWVHRLAGDVGEEKSAFVQLIGGVPTWRQLELAAHRVCNDLFAKYIEDRARNTIKTMVEGGFVTAQQIDFVLDWLDKIRTSAGHLATAFTGHGLSLRYEEYHFPNRRIGLFDRVAIFYRVRDYPGPLHIWECMHPGFLTTPSALAVQIKDLVILTISNNFLLSQAFGLGQTRMIDGQLSWVEGSGVIGSGFGLRRTRLEAALIVAQPMRRQLVNAGVAMTSEALSKTGDGVVFHREDGRWRRTKRLDFSKLQTMDFQLGYALAGLEMVEWLILLKEEDHKRMGSPKRNVSLNSIDELRDIKTQLLASVAASRSGIWPLESDRTFC